MCCLPGLDWSPNSLVGREAMMVVQLVTEVPKRWVVELTRDCGVGRWGGTVLWKTGGWLYHAM